MNLKQIINKYFIDYNTSELQAFYEDNHKLEQTIKDLINAIEDRHQKVLIKKIVLVRKKFKLVGVKLER